MSNAYRSRESVKPGHFISMRPSTLLQRPEYLLTPSANSMHPITQKCNFLGTIAEFSA